MKTTKKIIISIDVETEYDIEVISAAVKKGLYYGLDVKRVAAPKDVKVNYCQER
jgi:hypothetical protein